MTQMGRQWWPKTITSTTTGATAVDTLYGGGRTTRNCSATSSESNAATLSSCCGLSRLMRKLKRRSNKMLKTAASSTTYTSRQSSFQCRYDPLSYALNFDTSGTGSLLDEDYYKICAFSSRFVATPKADHHHCQTLMAAASH